MKIAFIVNEFPVVSETFILNQIVGLLQRGHEVLIDAELPDERVTAGHSDIVKYELQARTYYRPPPPSWWPARIQSAVSRIVRWGWRSPATTLDSMNVFRHGREALNLTLLHNRLPAQAIVQKYDVIHCHFGPNGLRAVQLREFGALKGPIVTTFHGYDVNWLPRILGSGLYKRLFERGELFTVGSEFLRERALSLGAPADRIVKLPMGVSVSKFKFRIRKRNIGEDFRLLTVARLVEVKGVEYALRALAILLPKIPRLRYQIAGDGPKRQQLESLSRQLGLSDTVQFLGTVSQEQAAALYERAHVFVLPSIVTDAGEEEGQPVVLIEAQASGLPVIATAIGGIPESLDDGKSGILVPPKDPEALARAILSLASQTENWGRMGYAGRAHVEKRFDLDRLNDELVETYRKVLC